MTDLIKDSLWKQFGASIDMLQNAIDRWPDEYWQAKKKFFYIAYHTVLFLDYYLEVPAIELSVSPLPFTLTEDEDIPVEAIDDLVPDKIYSKQELLNYLQHCRDKCKTLLAGMDETRIAEEWVEKSGNKKFPVIELLLYNMRHVQHHAAQLNMLLRQRTGDAPGWIRQAKDDR